MTSESEFVCPCGGILATFDTHETSATAFCRECTHCSLIVGWGDSHWGLTHKAVYLRDFHLKRGDRPGQRSMSDLSMAKHLVSSLLRDEWPSPATVNDFGIASEDHLGTLQHIVRSGGTAYDFDRVTGDGPAITSLSRCFGRSPYIPVKFVTPYDDLVPEPLDG